MTNEDVIGLTPNCFECGAAPDQKHASACFVTALSTSTRGVYPRYKPTEEEYEEWKRSMNEDIIEHQQMEHEWLMRELSYG